jgi:predicted P-loop ATPase
MTNIYNDLLIRHFNALQGLGTHLMPVVKSKATAEGKAPSFWKEDGTPALITGRDGWTLSQFQKQINLSRKLGKEVGIAIQPTDNLVIVDLDAKNYQGGKDECWQDYQRMVSLYPDLNETRTEITTNAGIHIYVRVLDLSEWRKDDGGLLQKLSTRDDRRICGELLANKSVCVTAPTRSEYKMVEGRPIDKVITINRLSDIGVYPVAKASNQAVTTKSQVANKATMTNNGPRLRDLISLKASRVLRGEYAYQDSNVEGKDRSIQLSSFAKEAYGCENLAKEHGITLCESSEELIEEVIRAFNLEDKSERVMKTVNPDRLRYTASNPSYVLRMLGVINERSGTKKPTITADIARRVLVDTMGSFRLRTRTDEIETSDGTLYSQDQLARLYIQLSEKSSYIWSRQIVIDTAQELAEQNKYDPIKEHFLDLAKSHPPLPNNKWDRLDQLLFGIDDPIAAMFMPKYLINAVTRLMEPGCSYAPTPILIGGQGARKSDCVKALFGEDYVNTGLGVNMGKDDLQKLYCRFCTEIAEFNGFASKADRERLKEFLTTTSDIYRPVYARGSIERHRNFVFWGNCNLTPLEDPTGNRRYVVIDLADKSHANQLPIAQITSHRGQIWSRAFVEYYKGTSFHFTQQEQDLVNSSNLSHTRTDSWQERLQELLALDPNHTYLSKSNAYDILSIDSSQRHKGNDTRMETILASLGYRLTKVPTPNGTRAMKYARASGQGVVHKPVNVIKCMECVYK